MSLRNSVIWNLSSKRVYLCNLKFCRYFLSLAYIASLFPGFLCMRTVSSFSDSCSTTILRLTNGVLAVLCSILVYEIIIHLRPSLDDKKASLHAVILSLYPLHWFFTFLYYTDVASLTAVLAMYLLVLKKKYLFSSLLGTVAVLIRQTNIIWLLFVACTGVIEFAQSHRKDRGELEALSTSKENDGLSANHTVISKLRKRRVNNGAKNQKKLAVEMSNPVAHSSGLLDEIFSIIIISWNHFWDLLVLLSPFFMASFDRAKKWVQELQAQGNPNMVMALAGNKSDLLDGRKVEAEVAQTYAQENGLFFMETSAKTAANVNEIFHEIAKRLPRLQQTPNPSGMVLVDRPAERASTASCCS